MADDKTVSIKLEATGGDQLKATFKDAAQSADAMGKGIDAGVQPALKALQALGKDGEISTKQLMEVAKQTGVSWEQLASMIGTQSDRAKQPLRDLSAVADQLQAHMRETGLTAQQAAKDLGLSGDEAMRVVGQLRLYDQAQREAAQSAKTAAKEEADAAKQAAKVEIDAKKEVVKAAKDAAKQEAAAAREAEDSIKESRRNRTDMAVAGYGLQMVGSQLTGAKEGVNDLADLGNAADRANLQLEAMMEKRGEGARLGEMKQFLDQLAYLAAFKDEDPLKKAAAGLEGFGIGTDKIKGLLPGLIGQMRLYNKESGDSTDLETYADRVGTALETLNVRQLHRLKITLPDEDLQHLQDLKDNGADHETRQQAAYEMLAKSFRNYSLNVNQGLSENEIAQNRYALALNKTEKELGQGASDAKANMSKLGTSILDALKASDGFKRGAGEIYGYGASVVSAVGSVASFVGQFIIAKAAVQQVVMMREAAAARNAKAAGTESIAEGKAAIAKEDAAKAAGDLARADVKEAESNEAAGDVALEQVVKYEALTKAKNDAARAGGGGAGGVVNEVENDVAGAAKGGGGAAVEKGAVKEVAKDVAPTVAKDAATAAESEGSSLLVKGAETGGTVAAGGLLAKFKGRIAGLFSRGGAEEVAKDAAAKFVPVAEELEPYAGYNAAMLAKQAAPGVAAKAPGLLSRVVRGGGARVLNAAKGAGSGLSEFAETGKLLAPTAGRVAGGVAAGAIGAYSQYNDMQALGYGKGVSGVAAGATGLAEGAISFVPGIGWVAVATTEGIRYGVNHFYNEGMEAKAGTGKLTQSETAMAAQESSKDFSARADALQKRSDEAEDPREKAALKISADLARKKADQQAKIAKNEQENADLTAKAFEEQKAAMAAGTQQSDVTAKLSDTYAAQIRDLEAQKRDLNAHLSKNEKKRIDNEIALLHEREADAKKQEREDDRLHKAQADEVAAEIKANAKVPIAKLTGERKVGDMREKEALEDRLDAISDAKDNGILDTHTARELSKEARRASERRKEAQDAEYQIRIDEENATRDYYAAMAEATKKQGGERKAAEEAATQAFIDAKNATHEKNDPVIKESNAYLARHPQNATNFRNKQDEYLLAGGSVEGIEKVEKGHLPTAEQQRYRDFIAGSGMMDGAGGGAQHPASPLERQYAHAGLRLNGQVIGHPGGQVIRVYGEIPISAETFAPRDYVEGIVEQHHERQMAGWK